MLPERWIPKLIYLHPQILINETYTDYHFCVSKASLIGLISHIAQLLFTQATSQTEDNFCYKNIIRNLIFLRLSMQPW